MVLHDREQGGYQREDAGHDCCRIAKLVSCSPAHLGKIRIHLGEMGGQAPSGMMESLRSTTAGSEHVEWFGRASPGRRQNSFAMRVLSSAKPKLQDWAGSGRCKTSDTFGG
jgi:hypothetical protein